MVLRRTAALILALCAGALQCAPSLARDTPEGAKAAGRYVVRAVPSEGLVRPPPALPDLKPYTAAAVDAMIKRTPAGRVTLKRMVEVPTLHEFVGGHGRLGEWAARQTSNPRAILIEGGYMTPRDLARALPKEQFEETAPGVYVLRMPLVVQPGATLHIDAATKDFRMSQERGAFLVNDGMMFITGTHLTAWRERDNRPAWFRQPTEFRPFLVSWGGAKLYITGSVVTSLGYAASKAYGVAISQYSPHMDAQLHRPRATGWLLNSEFIDHWYGFYCYEADDVALIGNTYRDNIQYGIDPHDRSRRLIIAGNTVHGTKQKHGIIASREVNDSWIFGNRAFNNKLSGIVVDRNSVRNVVAYNESYRNGADGFTIYESPTNLLWGNRAVANQRHGFRLRNSVDIRLHDNVAAVNRLAGIYGHIKDLAGTERDPKLDPFELSISMVVVGGQLIYNGSGPVTLDRPLSVELYNVEMLAPPKRTGLQMTGVMGQHQAQILDILVRQRQAAIIVPAEVAAKPES